MHTTDTKLEEIKCEPHMATSPAYRVLSVIAVRMLAFIQCEIAFQRAWDGELPLAPDDFIAIGIRRQSVLMAICELRALGFITVKSGQAGKSNRYGLVPASSAGSWAKIDSMKVAREIKAHSRKIALTAWR